MAETLTDPAARLIEILSKALPVSTGEPYLKVWQQVFSLKDTNAVEIYHRLNLVWNTIHEVERGILQIPDIKHQVFLKPLPALRQIISRINLNEAWGASKPSLELALGGLEFCSERIQANNPEILIKRDDLDNIRTQVEDLIAQLKASDNIPPKLRYVLFDLLEAIRRSIDEYAFRGSKGLRRELFVIVAQIQESWEIIEPSKDKEEVSTFFKILRTFDKVTAVAMKVKELAGGVAPYVPILLEKIGQAIP